MKPIFTLAEKHQITSKFKLIRETEDYIEFQSYSTKHCWIIHKHHFSTLSYPILIYHKHSIKDPYYHKHWQTYSVRKAVESIIKHDEYVLVSNYGI